MVAAASPPPAPSPLPHVAPGRAHPTYTKMIKHALTELGGCSPRPAIAGYILDRFSGFPACHDALLSAHLRRLLAEGILRTHGADYIFAPAVPVVGEKRRGPGRPRKSPQASSDTPLLPAKRKHATEDDDDPVTKRGSGRPTTQEIRAEAASSSSIKRGRGRPRKEKPPEAAATSPTTGAAASRGFKRGCGRPSMDRASSAAVSAEAAGGQEATTFQNGGVQSGGASGAKRGRGRPRKQNPSAAAMSPEPPSSTKRGRGRPRKHKPPEAPAGSPTTGAAASRGFKRGCGRPSMDIASAPAVSAEASMDKAPSSAEASMEKLAATAAAMYDETGDAAASTGAGQSRMENLAAAAGEGTKRGRGRPRKEKPAPVAGAGVKRSRGRQGKDRSIRPRLVESPYDTFFRDMMAEASASLEEEDSVSGETTTQADNGVATGEGKETRAAADAAARVPVSGENAAPAPASATDPDLDPANLADDAASTGIKRPRGRPRKNKPSAAAAADDGMSTGVKRGRGRPRAEKLEEAMPAETGDAAPPTGVKRGCGRPRKERLEEGMSAETGVAAPTVVKRGRGRPRKKKRAADVKRGGGRPRKHQSSRTGFAEAAGEVLFRDMAEAPGNFVSLEKTH